MTGIPGAALLVLVGYLVGAIPFGWLVGRLAGVDLRQRGSGSTGATNALRTIGPAGAVLTFMLDFAKGLVVVLLVGSFYRAGPPGSLEWATAAAALAAIVGHIRSVFIGFRGGKGVATFAGAMLAISPLTVGLVVPIVALVVSRTRIVSLGSLVGCALAPLVTLVVFFGTGLATPAALALALGGASLVTVAHADNIARLRAGTERRIGR